MDNRFPLEVLPKELSTAILHKEKTSNWNPNALAGAFISATAGALGAKVSFFNREFTNTPIFWVVLVGDSASKKSPMLKYAFKFLNRLDNELAKETETAINKWEENGKTGKRPDEKHIILMDYTIESLARILKTNTNGVVLLQDELAGWLGSMNKYNGGSDEVNKYLSLYDGGALKVNRVNESIHVSQTNVNLIGGLQFKRLPKVINSDNKDSGFLQRFMMIRNLSNSPNLANRKGESTQVNRTLQVLFENLFEYPKTDFSWNEESLTIWADWTDEQERMRYKKVPDVEYQLWQKSNIIFMRIALILEVLSQVSVAKKKDYNNEITPETVRKTIQVIEWHLYEMKAILSEADNPLDRESDEFTEAYKSLEDRVYSTGELDNIFVEFLKSSTTRNKKYQNTELFIKEGYGKYKPIKAYCNERS